jgi:hypothetical protein
MKAINNVPGYPDLWLIDLEFSPWSPKQYVLRSEGMNGETVTFKDRAEAEAKIKELLAGGEQAAIFKYGPAPTVPAQTKLTPMHTPEPISHPPLEPLPQHPAPAPMPPQVTREPDTRNPGRTSK